MKKHLKKLKGNVQRYVKLAKEKVRQRQIKRTTIALLLTLPYLLLEWTARAFDLYTYSPLIDIPIHIFFGVAFASITILVYYKSLSFVLIWSFIVSVFWESVEIAGDFFVPAAAVLLDPLFYDGITDVVTTFVGAIITIYVIRKFIK